MEDKVVCSDDTGVTIASFEASAVTAFGVHPALRDPALAGPTDVGVRRDRELAEAPLASARLFSQASF